MWRDSNIVSETPDPFAVDAGADRVPAYGPCTSPVSPTPDQWRPKDGVYALPGKDFKSSCDERYDLTIGLRGKSVGGYEWTCQVKSVTDLSRRGR